MDAADEMQNATVSKLYDLFGDSENPKCGVNTQQKDIQLMQKETLLIEGSHPPPKKDMDYGHALIPRKKILSVRKHVCPFIYGKRDRRYPRLNHGWFLSFQISRWGLPAIQTGLYNETPMNVRKIHPQLQSLLVNTYSCFYHFFFVISFTLQ